MQAENLTGKQEIRHKYTQIRQIVEKKFNVADTPNHMRVAELLGLPPGTTKRWQSSGKYTPEEALLLQKTLGISRDWVLFDEGDLLDGPAGQEELARLRAENAALRAELERLKG